MRLWHQKLISKLPRQQLLGQHRECCALRGNGWGRKHSTVDYVFRYSPKRLFYYHKIVLDEMSHRDYKIDEKWLDPCYRGRFCDSYKEIIEKYPINQIPLYIEHNDEYLQECIDNLNGI